MAINGLSWGTFNKFQLGVRPLWSKSGLIESFIQLLRPLLPISPASTDTLASNEGALFLILLQEISTIFDHFSSSSEILSRVLILILWRLIIAILWAKSNIDKSCVLLVKK